MLRQTISGTRRTRFFSFDLVCQKIIQQRYGLTTSTSSSNRSLVSGQQSPLSNQMRSLPNSHSAPSPSYITPTMNLAQTAPASSFSSHRYEHQPIISPTPAGRLSATQYFHTSTINGVLQDRQHHPYQQQSIQIDKRHRAVKEQAATKLSPLTETFSLPVHDGQARLDMHEQSTPISTPTQKRKETKRKSNIFTVRVKCDD